MTINPHFHVEEMFLGTTFDDFTLSPWGNITESRSKIPLKTQFSENVSLNLPVVSANMGTVTGPAMAIAMAQEGGIGILPRGGVSIDSEMKWVGEVKRAENFIIENPYTIDENATLAEARVVMKMRRISTLLVIGEMDKLVGILSAKRKMMLYGDDYGDTKVNKVMTPIDEREYTAIPEIMSVEQAAEELAKHDRGKLPWVFPDMSVRGLITIKDISNLLHHKWANKDAKGRLIVGAAIGVRGDYIERAAELIKTGVDVIVMDTAHAHNTKVVVPAIENFRKHFGNFELVCGNVATHEGAEILSKLVDGIKVGIGPGAGCQTRNETGVGVGQLDAIRTAYLASNRVPNIADGGVKKPGDIAKALAMGASSVMLGEFLAGTEESPGKIINDPKKGRIKIYRGETSPQSKIYGSDISDETELRNVEGQEKEIKVEGSVKDKLARIREGLQSMVSYMGGKNLAEVRKKINAEPWKYFRPASEATQRESYDK